MKLLKGLEVRKAISTPHLPQDDQERDYFENYVPLKKLPHPFYAHPSHPSNKQNDVPKELSLQSNIPSRQSDEHDSSTEQLNPFLFSDPLQELAAAAEEENKEHRDQKKKKKHHHHHHHHHVSKKKTIHIKAKKGGVIHGNATPQMTRTYNLTAKFAHLTPAHPAPQLPLPVQVPSPRKSKGSKFKLGAQKAIGVQLDEMSQYKFTSDFISQPFPIGLDPEPQIEQTFLLHVYNAEADQVSIELQSFTPWEVKRLVDAERYKDTEMEWGSSPTNKSNNSGKPKVAKLSRPVDWDRVPMFNEVRIAVRDVRDAKKGIMSQYFSLVGKNTVLGALNVRLELLPLTLFQ